MKRLTLGISVITVLAVPLALATDWATDREAARDTLAARETVAPEQFIPMGMIETPTKVATEEIRIYPSF